MDNSAYITLSRQLALFRDMDVTANNLANANTVGYNSEHILFNSFLTRDINQRVPNSISFANDIATYRKLENGPMQTTGNQLDVAIRGSGYFAVETPLGTRYTRAGNFQIGGDGTLMTASGYAVLDPSNQRITFPDNVRTIDIGSAGNIKVNGDDFGNIGIVQFDNEQLVEKQGNGLYVAQASPRPAENVTVMQGVLEGSNTQPVMELTRMIEVSRAVSDTAKIVSTIYDLERKTSNAWAQQ